MGCGCRERADRYGKRLEERGLPRLASGVRRLPDITDRVKSAAVNAVRPKRLQLRGGPPQKGDD